MDNETIPEESKPINIAGRRADLLRLWSDVFSLCDTLVQQAREGKDITGSSLQQILAFLRMSKDVLNDAAELEKQEALRQARERADGERRDNSLNTVGSFAVGYDPDEDVPFPIDDTDLDGLVTE